MSIPSPRKTLELLRKLFGLLFLIIGVLMIFLPPEINGLVSPIKEVAGFIVILIAFYLLFKGII